MQLQKENVAQKYRGTFQGMITIGREEGIRALYRGLTASYVGTSESTIQFVLYEKLKKHYSMHYTNAAHTGILQHCTSI